MLACEAPPSRALMRMSLRHRLFPGLLLVAGCSSAATDADADTTCAGYISLEGERFVNDDTNELGINWQREYCLNEGPAALTEACQVVLGTSVCPMFAELVSMLEWFERPDGKYELIGCLGADASPQYDLARWRDRNGLTSTLSSPPRAA